MWRPWQTPRRAPSALSVAVAAQLRFEQGRSGMSLEDLARRAGISRAALRAVLTAQRVPDAAQLVALCRVFDVPLVDLFRRAEHRLEDRTSEP